jgi:stearoyl-CoA desaturase (delta-9 desaturase)
MNPSSAPLSRIHRAAAISLVVLPALGFVAASVAAWHSSLRPWHLGIAIVFYLISGFGITMGFHRLFTHKSFRASPLLRGFLCVAGSMAFQGPVFFWAALHREHHRHSDCEMDPHTPNHHGEGFRGTIRGLWHAHVGWMLTLRGVAYRRLVPDLLKDPLLVSLSRYYGVWVALGVLLPGIISLAFEASLGNFLVGCLYGGLARIFLVSHATWSVNSLCHCFGARAFATPDQSRNNRWCALWSLGEGWHNNHHAFPVSARHGLLKGQLDPTYWMIRLCERAGWASDVRLPRHRELMPDFEAGPAMEATGPNSNQFLP